MPNSGELLIDDIAKPRRALQIHGGDADLPHIPFYAYRVK